MSAELDGRSLVGWLLGGHEYQWDVHDLLELSAMGLKLLSESQQYHWLGPPEVTTPRQGKGTELSESWEGFHLEKLTRRLTEPNCLISR